MLKLREFSKYGVSVQKVASLRCTQEQEQERVREGWGSEEWYRAKQLLLGLGKAGGGETGGPLTHFQCPDHTQIY
jgi:hypothetical protein